MTDETDRTIVGREFSKVFWYFLSHGGKISCEVTAKRKYGKRFVDPHVYKFLGSENMKKSLVCLLYLTPNRNYIFATAFLKATNIERFHFTLLDCIKNMNFQKMHM